MTEPEPAVVEGKPTCPEHPDAGAMVANRMGFRANWVCLECGQNLGEAKWQPPITETQELG